MMRMDRHNGHTISTMVFQAFPQDFTRAVGTTMYGADGLNRDELDGEHDGISG